jgi:NAD(P)-dependent dehydrogenase (short-subunit alcohol dehydrogenase family)
MLFWLVIAGLLPLLSLYPPINQLINNAGYFYEPEETIETMNFKEQIKQIDICAVGPLRVAAAFLHGDLLQKGSKVIMITSQGGSVEWRFTQNPKGHDYGHHVSENSAGLTIVSLRLVSTRLKRNSAMPHQNTHVRTPKT